MPLGKEITMKFFMEKKNVLEKDKSRPPETSEEIAAERSSQNESTDITKNSES